MVASSFKGLTGSQSSGPGREDVVHEPDRAVGSLFVHGEGLERPDQVGLALASVQMVLAQPGTGAVQQLCRRPAQSQGHALRQGVGSLPLPAWNRHQHCCCRQGEALRQQLNQGRKRFALARLTQLQQQLAQRACVRPESAPRQGQQALEPLTRESKGIEARGAGSRRRQRAVPRSIADRAAGLDQKGLGKARSARCTAGRSLQRAFPCWAESLRDQAPSLGIARSMATKVRWASSLSVRV